MSTQTQRQIRIPVPDKADATISWLHLRTPRQIDRRPPSRTPDPQNAELSHEGSPNARKEEIKGTWVYMAVADLWAVGEDGVGVAGVGERVGDDEVGAPHHADVELPDHLLLVRRRRRRRHVEAAFREGRGGVVL